MSALGQSRQIDLLRRLRHVRFAPKADMRGVPGFVCFVPIATECSAAKVSRLDHLFGAREGE